MSHTASTDLAGALPDEVADYIRSRRQKAADRAGAWWPLDADARTAYRRDIDSELLDQLVGEVPA